MDPFEQSTAAKWMGVSEKEYEVLYSISERTGKCLRFDCTTISGSHDDLMCPTHRKEYNEWTKQFFPLVYKKQTTKVPVTKQKENP